MVFVKHAAFRTSFLFVGLTALISACSSTPSPDGGGSGGVGSGGVPSASGGAPTGSGGAIGASGGAPATGGGGPGSGGAPSSGGADPGSGGGGSDGSGGRVSTCVPDGRARNPLVGHLFTADPSAAVFGDRIYVYTSHDVDNQTAFDMTDYHAYSSDDLVNWQDHGVIIEASSLPWATNLYAPGACEKGGKYYLYMPNSGSGVGVAVSNSPGGPFVDPLGTALVTSSVPGVGDVDWLFDPACFVDEDGQGYLYFGGGPPDTGDNGRVMRLGDDMITLKDASATTIVIPQFFEAAFMHRRGDMYYLSYSTNFEGHAAYLDYMTSDNPMTGFTYRGTILTNGNINMGNNNHGSIVEFQGKTYLFYHNRKLELDTNPGSDNEYQRSIAVQEITYDGDLIQQMDMSTADTTVAQIKCLDGFSEVEAERMAAQKGIEVEGDGDIGVHVVDLDPGDWIGYSQVDFWDGATKLVVKVASAAGGGEIDVRIDGCGDFTDQAGTSIGTCEVPATGGDTTFVDLECTLTQTSGGHDLCLQFAGNTDFRLDSFHLE